MRVITERESKKLPIGSLMVAHFPQIPCKPFTVQVDSIAEGRALIEILGWYDDFQFKARIKPDYSNASVLSRMEEGEDGAEWYDVDEDETDENAETFAAEVSK